MFLTIAKLILCVFLTPAFADLYPPSARGIPKLRRGGIRNQEAAFSRDLGLPQQFQTHDMTSQKPYPVQSIRRRSPWSLVSSPTDGHTPTESRESVPIRLAGTGTEELIRATRRMEGINAANTIYLHIFHGGQLYRSQRAARAAALSQFDQRSQACTESLAQWTQVYTDPHIHFASLEATHGMWRALTRMQTILQAFHSVSSVAPLPVQPLSGGSAHEYWVFTE